jgi:hypothetical protein
LAVPFSFWPRFFCSDCCLQGVEGSPVSKTFADQLDKFRGRHPKNSVMQEKLCRDPKLDPHGKEFGMKGY